MQWPTEPAQKPTRKTVLIWGDSSSVGSSGIQLAVAAGYEVISTASVKNFNYVKKLGTRQVFDYNSPTVVEVIVSTCKGKTMAGALDCIGPLATVARMNIMQMVDGNRTVVSTNPKPKEILEGVTVKHIFGPSLKDRPLGLAIWEEFLLKALESGSFVAAPEPQIVGKGLEAVQEAVDLVQKGVSATKLVVLLR